MIQPSLLAHTSCAERCPRRSRIGRVRSSRVARMAENEEQAACFVHAEVTLVRATPRRLLLVPVLVVRFGCLCRAAREQCVRSVGWALLVRAAAPARCPLCASERSPAIPTVRTIVSDQPARTTTVQCPEHTSRDRVQCSAPSAMSVLSAAPLTPEQDAQARTSVVSGHRTHNTRTQHGQTWKPRRVRSLTGGLHVLHALWLLCLLCCVCPLQ